MRCRTRSIAAGAGLGGGRGGRPDPRRLSNGRNAPRPRSSSSRALADAGSSGAGRGVPRSEIRGDRAGASAGSTPGVRARTLPLARPRSRSPRGPRRRTQLELHASATGATSAGAERRGWDARGRRRRAGEPAAPPAHPRASARAAPRERARASPIATASRSARGAGACDERRAGTMMLAPRASLPTIIENVETTRQRSVVRQTPSCKNNARAGFSASARSPSSSSLAASPPAGAPTSTSLFGVHDTGCICDA